MSKFDFNKLNEQFKQTVKEINERADSEIQMLIDYANSLHLSEDEIEKAFVNYRQMYEMNEMFFTNKYGNNSVYESTTIKSSLPTPGEIEKMNVRNAEETIKHISAVFNLADWQHVIASDFRTNGIHAPQLAIPAHSCWEQLPISMVIPDLDNNLKYVDAEFQKCGYYRVKTFTRDFNGKKFILCLYNPYRQDSISDYIRKSCKILLHASPVVYHDSIRNNGFSPKSASLTNNHPPRLFFNVDNNNSEEFYNMLGEIVNTRQGEDNFTNHYILYTLSTKRIPDNIEFYADPNCVDCCYVTEKVPYSAVIDEEEIVINPIPAE